MKTSAYHPAFGSVVNMSETYVPDDPDGQVEATIALMRRYALEDAGAHVIQRDALEALQGAFGAGVDPATLTDDQKIEAVFRYVKGRISFVEDERLTNGFGRHDPEAPFVEALIRPVDMAVMCERGSCRRVGDCDDFSMYTAALLGALGVRASFVTVAADPSQPQQFSHVYVAAYPRGGERTPMDTSHGPRLGWEVENPTRIQEWPLQPSAATLLVGGIVLWAVLRGLGAI